MKEYKMFNTLIDSEIFVIEFDKTDLRERPEEVEDKINDILKNSPDDIIYNGMFIMAPETVALHNLDEECSILKFYLNTINQPILRLFVHHDTYQDEKLKIIYAYKYKHMRIEKEAG